MSIVSFFCEFMIDGLREILRLHEIALNNDCDSIY
jgi:hypothetical protein